MQADMPHGRSDYRRPKMQQRALTTTVIANDPHTLFFGEVKVKALKHLMPVAVGKAYIFKLYNIHTILIRTLQQRRFVLQPTTRKR